MKYFKYIALLLLVAVVMGACEKKEISYMAEPVDEGSKAYVQIGYYAPVTAGAANYIYYVTIDGVQYGNSGSTFLATYNAIPSGGINRYYTVDAGSVNIKFHKKDGTVVYDKTVDNIAAGNRYCLFVHDLNKAPIAIQMNDVPAFQAGLDTDSLCHVQFINLLYEEDGTPFKDKVQYAVQDDATKQYVAVGTPVAFGERTDWFTTVIHKTVYNSSGSQRKYVCMYRIDANTGANLGVLQYTNNAGNMVDFTDYWTWYIGRAYRQVVAGNRNSSSIRLALYQFTIQ